MQMGCPIGLRKAVEFRQYYSWVRASCPETRRTQAKVLIGGQVLLDNCWSWDKPEAEERDPVHSLVVSTALHAMTRKPRPGERCDGELHGKYIDFRVQVLPPAVRTPAGPTTGLSCGDSQMNCQSCIKSTTHLSRYQFLH